MSVDTEIQRLGPWKDTPVLTRNLRKVPGLQKDQKKIYCPNDRNSTCSFKKTDALWDLSGYCGGYNNIACLQIFLFISKREGGKGPFQGLVENHPCSPLPALERKLIQSRPISNHQVTHYHTTCTTIQAQQQSPGDLLLLSSSHCAEASVV